MVLVFGLVLQNEDYGEASNDGSTCEYDNDTCDARKSPLVPCDGAGAGVKHR